MKALIPILAATAALTFSATMTSTVTAAGSNHTTRHVRTEVTSGQFETLPGGASLGYELQGRAVMIRSGDETTVRVRIKGLDANATYPTHVHNQPCSATPPGGSHYQHDVPGPVDAVNELWPTISTNRHGNGVGRATHEHRARADAQSIVVHYPSDTSIRLACVDL